MVMHQVTIRLSEDTLREFDRAAMQQGQARDSLLTQLVQEYVQRSVQPQEIGQLTLAALGLKSPRLRHKRAFNARKVARALEKTFGTRDGVEIINRHREYGIIRS